MPLPRPQHFPTGEIPVDIVHGDHWLRQDVLPENAVFGISTRIIRKSAVMPVESE